MIWRYETVVQWNGESFKGEGVFNMAIPCDSSQEFFYVSLIPCNHRVYTNLGSQWLFVLNDVHVEYIVMYFCKAIVPCCTYTYVHSSIVTTGVRNNIQKSTCAK